jgi:hypothetical protein
MRFHTAFAAVALLSLVSTCCSHLAGQEWISGVEFPEPPVVEPGATDDAPSSDAIVLFDGRDLSQWEGGEEWEVRDGVAISRGGGITTKESFRDVQLHVEWSAPEEIEGSGQGRGNSGVYLMGKYEVQVLDSYQNPTYYDGQAAAIYKQTPPMVNAMRKPGEWNTYDIVFTAPRFRVDGSIETPAYVTVLHNGVCVLNHFEIQGSTNWHKPPEYEPHPEKSPISLQFHGNPVRFRNIWVREIKPLVGTRVSGPYVKLHDLPSEDEEE